MGSRRCDSNISALRVPSVWRISVICLIARLHFVATDQIPVCALKDLQVEMVSDLRCSWSNGSSICSSLEDCSTKQIICDLNNPQVSFTCRITYERKGQKCIKLTGTSKDKQCFYSNGLRIHDREGCINDSSVRCYSDYKCDSKCRAYAPEIDSASGQRNGIFKVTNNKNLNEVCALKDLQVEMVSDLRCSWSNGRSICSSLEECSTKPIICDVNNPQVSFTCRITYERKGQKCIKLTGTSKDKPCFYSNKSRIHDMEGCINDSSVTCSSDYKCDSECKAYALEVDSASGQRNSSLKETNNNNLNEGSVAFTVGTQTVAIIVSAVFLLHAVLAAVIIGAKVLRSNRGSLETDYSSVRDLRWGECGKARDRRGSSSGRLDEIRQAGDDQENRIRVTLIKETSNIALETGVLEFQMNGPGATPRSSVGHMPGCSWTGGEVEGCHNWDAKKLLFGRERVTSIIQENRVQAMSRSSREPKWQRRIAQRKTSYSNCDLRAEKDLENHIRDRSPVIITLKL